MQNFSVASDPKVKAARKKQTPKCIAIHDVTLGAALLVDLADRLSNLLKNLYAVSQQVKAELGR
jgi:hypothetical protein